MSAYTTLRITRTKARAYLLQRLMLTIQHGSDEALEKMMDTELERRLFKTIIVSDKETNNDDGGL